MVVQQSDIGEAASALAQARQTVRPLDRLPMDPESVPLEHAYAIQDRLHALLEPEFGPLAGHKIGCTTQVMQDYLKIDHPCAGRVRAKTVYAEQAAMPRASLVRPGVECEIAVMLGGDMPPRHGGYDRASAGGAVATAMASIELVDERWTDFTKRPTSSLVADDFFNAGCVLGPGAAVDPIQMDALTGWMKINGALIGEGTGADILGHPMDALAWLANERAAQGQPLRSGEFVTLGSIVKTVWVEAGDRIEMEIDGLGQASLVIY